MASWFSLILSRYSAADNDIGWVETDAAWILLSLSKDSNALPQRNEESCLLNNAKNTILEHKVDRHVKGPFKMLQIQHTDGQRRCENLELQMAERVKETRWVLQRYTHLCNVFNELNASSTQELEKALNLAAEREEAQADINKGLQDDIALLCRHNLQLEKQLQKLQDNFTKKRSLNGKSYSKKRSKTS